MSDIRELLPLYALGVLDPDEVRAGRACGRDRSGARGRAAEIVQATDSLIDPVAPVAPSAEVKARLLASVGGGRFEKFSARIASLFDVTVDRARELLGLVERQASWENPMPGHRPGPFLGWSGLCDRGLRLRPDRAGRTFPWHTHRGEEVYVGPRRRPARARRPRAAPWGRDGVRWRYSSTTSPQRATRT